mmetsp:Transcript_32083/g.96634  ORF Transcript_32083/g.96634 Transcript_32083/m.96634 type:complete len:789 (+) Transcript_32083:1173-3539(+)
MHKCGALATLLYCGASSTSKSKNGHPLLHLAASCATPDMQILELLCGIADVNVDERGPGGCTALHRACEQGHTHIVNYLIAHGADVEAVDTVGAGCAQYARDHRSVLEVLAPFASDTSRDDDLSWARLIKAVTKFDDSQPLDAECNADLVRLTASLPQAALDCAPAGKDPALVVAVQLQKVGAVGCLLDNGASVRSTALGGRSLLGMCTTMAKLPLDVMGLLCEQGLSVTDLADADGTVAEAVCRREDVATIAAHPAHGNAFLSDMHETVWAAADLAESQISLADRVAQRIADAERSIETPDYEAERAAVSIQAAYRGHTARKEMTRHHAAARLIQTSFRTHAMAKAKAAESVTMTGAVNVVADNGSVLAPLPSGDTEMAAPDYKGAHHSDCETVIQENTEFDEAHIVHTDRPLPKESNGVTRTPSARLKIPAPPPETPPPSHVTKVRKVGFAEAEPAPAQEDTSEPPLRFVQDGPVGQVDQTPVPQQCSDDERRSSLHHRIESAASAQALHHDEDVIRMFREGLFTSDRMSEATRVQVLEVRLLMSKYFRSQKQLYEVAMSAPLEGESRVSTGERGNCLNVYTRGKQADDTDILFMTQVGKVDKATYAKAKDDVLLLSNAALFVITPSKLKLKYRIPYRDIEKLSFSSFYDGVFVVHTVDKEFGDRIYDAENGIHAMEIGAHLMRAASIAGCGRDMPTLSCCSEILHRIKGKRVGRVQFKLFGKPGLEVVKDKAGKKILRVTAPKLGTNDDVRVDRVALSAAAASPLHVGPISPTPSSDSRSWHELE